MGICPSLSIWLILKLISLQSCHLCGFFCLVIVARERERKNSRRFRRQFSSHLNFNLTSLHSTGLQRIFLETYRLKMIELLVHESSSTHSVMCIYHMDLYSIVSRRWTRETCFILFGEVYIRLLQSELVSLVCRMVARFYCKSHSLGVVDRT